MRPFKSSVVLLIFCISLTTFISCKDDSTSSEDITIEIISATSSFTEINTCDIDSGDLATEFLFALEYETSDEVEIDGVEFDLTWSDGFEDTNIFSEEFQATDQTVLFDWCFRYGPEDWFELDLKILAEDEEVESNEYTIRVTRPEGVNKGLTYGRN